MTDSSHRPRTRRLLAVVSLLSLTSCSAFDSRLQRAGDCEGDSAAGGSLVSTSTASQSASSAALPSAGGLLAYAGSTAWAGEVLASYEAASGRQCQQVAFRAPDGFTTAERIVCRAGGGWQLVPPLMGGDAGPQLSLRPAGASAQTAATQGNAKDRNGRCGTL